MAICGCYGKNRKIDNIAGTLFAYVAKDSLDAGFEDFVVFDSKTVLIDHSLRKEQWLKI
jgi:hypothetical protein